jgi:hypothetical protein
MGVSQNEVPNQGPKLGFQIGVPNQGPKSGVNKRGVAQSSQYWDWDIINSEFKSKILRTPFFQKSYLSLSTVLGVKVIYGLHGLAVNL